MSLPLETLRSSWTGRAARGAALASTLLLLPALAGCGATEGIGGGVIGSKLLSGTSSGPQEMDPAIYAATPVCPEVLVRDGTEFMPIFEAGRSGNIDAIRFQASVQRVARDCDETAEGKIHVRVGAAGRVLSGRSAATGSVSVPVRVAVTAGDKVLYSKLTQAQVSVQAPDYSALWSIVDDGIVLTVEETKAVTIFVGLDGKGEVARPQKSKKRVTK